MSNIPEQSKDRPPIPLDLKRTVRQRCGFGCVICGLPLYQYDHLYDYSVTQRHCEEEITLLCDRHHREKTARLLPLDQVLEANKDPSNRRKGTSTGYLLHFSGSQYSIRLAGTTFETNPSSSTGTLVPIIIDDEPIMFFRQEDEHLLLNFSYYDRQNTLRLRVDDNELVYETSVWDVELIGKSLVLRDSLRSVILDIQFNPPSEVVVNRAQINRNGIYLEITQTAITIKNRNSSVSGMGKIVSNVGLAIGASTSMIERAAAIVIRVPDDRRYRDYAQGP
jgi:hypothetical protein